MGSSQNFFLSLTHKKTASYTKIKTTEYYRVHILQQSALLQIGRSVFQEEKRPMSWAEKLNVVGSRRLDVDYETDISCQCQQLLQRQAVSRTKGYDDWYDDFSI